MKIRKRKASEWTEEESRERGGYVEFFEDGNVENWCDAPLSEGSTFLYKDEFDKLFTEPLPEIEVGDWIKTKYHDAWALVYEIVDGILYTYRYTNVGIAAGRVKQAGVIDVFKATKPEDVK